MKLFFKCKCCNKKNTICEIIMEAGWHQGDFKALETFLTLLQGNIKNGEKLEMSLDDFENEKKKIPAFLQNKYVAEKDRGKPEEEKEEERDRESEWTMLGISETEAQEWIKIGVNEPALALWIKEEKHFNPNQASEYLEDLRAEYYEQFDQDA